MPRRFRWACALVLAWPAIAWADLNLTKVGLGIDCSNGRYGGTTSTNICAFPASLDIFRGAWEVKLIAPYIGSHSGGVTAAGMGDATLYAARTWDQLPVALDEFDVGVRVKFANGRADKGLSNGEIGYQFELGAVKTWGPNLLISYVGVSTSAMSPSRRVAPYVNLWFKHELSSTWTLGWIYENYNLRNASRSVADIVFIPEYRATSKVTLKPMIYTGLTRNTADIGVGLLVTYAVD